MNRSQKYLLFASAEASVCTHLGAGTSSECADRRHPRTYIYLLAMCPVRGGVNGGQWHESADQVRGISRHLDLTCARRLFTEPIAGKCRTKARDWPREASTVARLMSRSLERAYEFGYRRLGRYAVSSAQEQISARSSKVKLRGPLPIKRTARLAL
jgi:hypothetical protein